MQTARKLRPAANVFRLPGAARKPVKQPHVPFPPRMSKWAVGLARRIASSAPAGKPYIVGSTADPSDLDDFGSLTFVVFYGWKGDGRSPWDAAYLATDRMLVSRGLVIVGAASVRRETDGVVVSCTLYRGGDQWDRAIAADHLRRAHVCRLMGRPYLRVIR